MAKKNSASAQQASLVSKNCQPYQQNYETWLVILKSKERINILKLKINNISIKKQGKHQLITH